MAADVVDHNKIIFGEPDEPGAAFEGIRMQLDAFDPFHIEVEAIFLLTLREGRIGEIRAVSDRLGLFLQLGWDWPEAD